MIRRAGNVAGRLGAAMEKNILLKVKGTRMENGEDESIEFVTEAKFRGDNGKYMVEYNESELTGMDGTHTVITLKPDEVSILRTGKNNSHLHFEKGRKHVTMYETEFGTMSMGVFSRRVNVNLGDSGGEVDFDYALEINNMQTSENNFYMEIWEA